MTGRQGDLETRRPVYLSYLEEFIKKNKFPIYQGKGDYDVKK